MIQEGIVVLRIRGTSKNALYTWEDGTAPEKRFW